MTDQFRFLSVRAYEAADWPAARLIHDLARPIELAGSCDSRAFVPLADDENDLIEFNQCQKLVACLHGRVVGFVGIGGNQIGWLYVHPDEARQGIGRSLLEEGLQRIDAKAEVHVLEGNEPALALYLSQGFSVVDRFKSRNNGYPCVVLKLAQ